MYEIEDKEYIQEEKREVSGSRRKDWIKNFTIIFLIIMLILTFFSNTIMNYTLPQVATAYVQSGEITPKVRGSGAAEVEDPYNVAVPSSRTIASVQVRVGDVVSQGDVIYELLDTESEDLTNARKELSDAEDNFQKALFAGNLTNSALNRIREGNYLSEDEMTEQLAAVNAAYNSAVEESANAQAALEKIQTKASSTSSTTPSGQSTGESDEAVTTESVDYSAEIAEATNRKTDADAALTKATNERDETVKSIQAELELKTMQKTVDEAREKVETLESQEVGATVTAPVSGTITSLNYSAGDVTSSGSAGAVIQQEGKGMTVSFTVTKEQAQTLSVGIEAKPQNEWAYSDFQATLTNITADPTDPTNSRLLTFEIVSSEVEAGSTVQLSVATSSKSYDLTVPNSAVREDNNGKFILVVTSKESPLGNRYIATRVDVTVLDSDDLNTAITGSLTGYEYVVTTATKPVSAGMQVRLAESETQ